jgi:hypothetical protein
VVIFKCRGCGSEDTDNADRLGEQFTILSERLFGRAASKGER